MHFALKAALAAGVLVTGQAGADWTSARCDIYPAGEDHVSKMIACDFGQRQGYVTITRSDGITHDLSPVGEDPGHYIDPQGRPVYRQSGLGAAGLIFRTADESVFVYWDTQALNPPKDETNATYPFSTADYDATTLLRCGSASGTATATCPAGILRMDGGQASIVIQSPKGEKFTVNFMQDYVNASSGGVEASLEGDTWIVIIDGADRYEVPLAAIEGG